jgi:PPK2 family polyphosphate:nucleotide phosphotransferase
MSERVNLRPYHAGTSGRFRLEDHDSGFLPRGATREGAERALATGIARLRGLQEKLYAENRGSVLIILQAMDAAGKDSAIEHVMSGVNPQGCEVHAFKAPSDEELDHNYLWRTTLRLPRRGRIGIFNRSYYEEVLVVRVHSDLLERQRIPGSLVTKHIWRERFEDMIGYERHLTRNGTAIRKIFLHVSKEEQRRRLLKRLDEPEKRWKFSVGDVEERRLWKRYMDAYEDMIRETSTDFAPWYVVPADHKWWTRAVVGAIVVEALEGLNLQFPKITGAKERELLRIRRALTGRT